MSEQMTAPTEQKVLAYLNVLRETGRTNMYLAAPYLERDLGLTKRKADDYVLRYMQSSVQGQLAPGGNR